ncbi:MAG: hypothetical protein ABIG44_00090 [Planctomycetota bacterium]
MREAFLKYLISEGVLGTSQNVAIQNSRRCAPEPIGSIAFSYGLINGGHIDAILGEQRKEYRSFGELAVDRGMLTPEQVQNLLMVQRMRTATETAETFVLSGMYPVNKLVWQLGNFLAEHSDTLMGIHIGSRD